MTRKLSLEDWIIRLDEFLAITLGKRSETIQGVYFDKLYYAGCSVGEVVEALVEVLREADAIPESQDVLGYIRG